MSLQKSDTQVDLSVVIIFYNMRREAKRTLLSLSAGYQHNTAGLSYEVIAIDNGSPQPLDKAWVQSFGSNFHYVYFDAQTASPCQALNYGAEIATGRYVTMCIDGARILSPGILNYSALASRIYENPFIYTLGMHIGAKPQNYLAEDGYSQKDEDLLMASLDWEHDGYSLFDISSLALSSGKGYLSELSESNCFTMLCSVFRQIGGFDERFKSAGGGLTNLDFFNRVHKIAGIQPVLLLGEATFHQFHGGTATNVPLKDRPSRIMAGEYKSIHGRPYRTYSIPPTFFGSVHPRCRRLLETLPAEPQPGICPGPG